MLKNFVMIIIKSFLLFSLRINSQKLFTANINGRCKPNIYNSNYFPLRIYNTIGRFERNDLNMESDLFYMSDAKIIERTDSNLATNKPKGGEKKNEIKKSSKSLKHRMLSKRWFYSDSRGRLSSPVKKDVLPVAIIGGGIGGTALALALQLKNIPVHMFEKDKSFSARKQGYGLTLQQGVMSLRKLGFESVSGGVVSISHASYLSSGEVIGVYGHDVRSAFSKKDNDKDNIDENNDTDEEDEPGHEDVNNDIMYIFLDRNYENYL